jgi:hypothetical protein
MKTAMFQAVVFLERFNPKTGVETADGADKQQLGNEHCLKVRSQRMNETGLTSAKSTKSAVSISEFRFNQARRFPWSISSKQINKCLLSSNKQSATPPHLY